MLIKFGIRNKTVKVLRKNKNYTVRELAERLRVDISALQAVDGIKLGDVPEPLYSRLLPILRGDDWDKMHWL